MILTQCLLYHTSLMVSLELNILGIFNLNNKNDLVIIEGLAAKQLELHGCVMRIVATEALMLNHEAISLHSADLTFVVQ